MLNHPMRIIGAGLKLHSLTVFNLIANCTDPSGSAVDAPTPLSLLMEKLPPVEQAAGGSLIVEADFSGNEPSGR